MIKFYGLVFIKRNNVHVKKHKENPLEYPPFYLLNIKILMICERIVIKSWFDYIIRIYACQ